MKAKIKGKHAELRVKQYYEKLGYEVLEMNYRYKRSEIDIIVLNKETLVFGEVKYRSSNLYGEPESFVSKLQEERIKAAAEEYIIGINWNKDIRFDVLSVDANNQIILFKDAF